MNGVRKFFKSVAIIDDDLFSTVEGRRSERPTQLFEHLQDEGNVVSPLKFKALDLVDRAVRLALEARLTILDWNLIEAKEQGQDATAPAFTIVRRLLEEKDEGMRWLIIYTDDKVEEIPKQLLGRLNEYWKGKPPKVHTQLPGEVHKALQQLEQVQDVVAAAVQQQLEQAVAVQRAPQEEAPVAVQQFKQAQEADTQATQQLGRIVRQGPPILLNGLFISVASKEITAGEVFDYFEDTLQRFFGPLPLTLLEVAATMDRTSFRTIRDFAKPFELPVYLQAMTSGIADAEIAPFLFELYTQNVIEAIQLAPEASEQLHQNHFAALKRALQYFATHPTEFKAFQDAVDRRGSELKLGQWKWKYLISELSQAESMNALLSLTANEEFLEKGGIAGKKKKRAQVLRVGLELLTAYAEVKRKWPQTEPTAYLEQLPDQVLRFTRLLKYVDVNPAEGPQTGTIYRDRHQPDRFLLCITPVCDVAQRKTDGHFKFVVGTKVWPPLENPEHQPGLHGTFIPLEEGLAYIVWEFAKTHVEQVSAERSALDEWIGSELTPTYFGLKYDEILPALPRLPYEASLAVLFIAFECNPDAEFITTVAESLGLLAGATAEAVRHGVEAPAWQQLLEHMSLAWDRQRLREYLRPSHFTLLYEPVVRFKREYAQQVMNRYLSYHARAGVQEVFFKEKDWQAHLLKLVRK